MRSRSFVAVVVAIVGLLAAAAGVLAYDSGQRNVIADGIKVGGVNVGGLNVTQARARLRASYLGILQRPVLARFHAHRFVLGAQSSHVAIDVDGSIAAALARTRSADLITRTWRSLTGGRINADIDPRISFSHTAVTGLVRRIASTLDHPSRDASLSYSGDSIGTVASRPGLTIDAGALRTAIEGALAHPAAGHEIRIAASQTEPRVTTRQLSARFPSVITIDRSAFTLRLWRRLKLVKSYPIAVGMAGLETPAGLYHVQDKQVDPSWFVPNSAWAGSLAGQVVPPGPSDPLKARWMGIFNGAGIHGIDPSEYGTIGHNASHGCIRMTIPDVIELYDQTPVGAPVYIA
jgi:lipoprotein-anchoring transpeptidase ErfK/SrfK